LKLVGHPQGNFKIITDAPSTPSAISERPVKNYLRGAAALDKNINVDIGLSLTGIPQVFLALALWPLAHIPAGAPALLAGCKDQEVNPPVLAASLALGQLVISAATYILYLLGFRFPLLGFLVIALVFPLWAWGIVILLRRPWSSAPRALLFGLLITVILILPRLLKGVVHDEGLHFSKVASILLGDHPLFVPNGTNGYIRSYHFGVDYLAAFWTWFAFPFRQWVPLNAIALGSSAAVYVLFYAFFRRFISESLASFAPFFAFWLGNWYSLLGLWDIVRGRSLVAILMNAISPTFFSYFIQPPMVFGMPILISALCLAEEGRNLRAGVSAGALLFANQVLFGAWLGYCLFRKRFWLALLTSLIACIPFLPSLAGGRQIADPPSFVFGFPLSTLLAAKNLPALLNYILFFFPLLPLYLHGMLLALRAPRRAGALPLLAVSLLCFIVPHFVAHSQGGHMFKLLMLWGVLGMPAALMSVEQLWKRSGFWKGLLVSILIPSLVSPILGFGITSARSRRLAKYELLRPDIIVAQKVLGRKGGVLTLQPPVKYLSLSGDTVEYQGLDPQVAERLYIVLVGAGIPRYPSEQIYGKARDFYEPLGRHWSSLEEIPEPLLLSRAVRFIALPRGAPAPALSDSVVFERDGFALVRLRSRR